MLPLKGPRLGGSYSKTTSNPPQIFDTGQPNFALASPGKGVPIFVHDHR